MIESDAVSIGYSTTWTHQLPFVLKMGVLLNMKKKVLAEVTYGNVEVEMDVMVNARGRINPLAVSRKIYNIARFNVTWTTTFDQGPGNAMPFPQQNIRFKSLTMDSTKIATACRGTHTHSPSPE